MEKTATVTPGKRAKNGPVSCETIGSAVGIDADPQPPGQALVDLLEPAAQILDLGENPVGVLQGHLALRRQADIAVAALDDRRPEIVLEQANRRRQRRLRHVAGVRGAAEMLFARERGEIFELTEDHDALSRRLSWRPAKHRSIAGSYRLGRSVWRSPNFATRSATTPNGGPMPEAEPDNAPRSRAFAIRIVATAAWSLRCSALRRSC